MKDNEHTTYILKEEYIDFKEAVNKVGRQQFSKKDDSSLYQNNVWTGGEIYLSQQIEHRMRCKFFDNIKKSKSLSKVLSGPEDILEFLFRDENFLITIWFLDVYGENPFLLQNEEIENLTAKWDTSIHGREHLIFMDARLSIINPEFVKNTMKAYQRYFYVEHLLRHLVCNEKIKAYQCDLLTGKYSECPSEYWGTSNFILNPLSSCAHFLSVGDNRSNIVIRFKKEAFADLTSDMLDYTTKDSKIQALDNDITSQLTDVVNSDESSTTTTLPFPRKKKSNRTHAHRAFIERIVYELDNPSYMNVWYHINNRFKEGNAPEISRIENDTIFWTSTKRTATKRTLKNIISKIRKLQKSEISS